MDFYLPPPAIIIPGKHVEDVLWSRGQRYEKRKIEQYELLLAAGQIINPYIFAGVTKTAIVPASHTVIGDMTSGGGNAAAFDANTSQSFPTVCSRTVGDVAGSYIGLQFASGKIFAEAKFYSPSDLSYFENSAAGTLNVRGSNSAVSAYTDGTQIGTSGALSSLGSGVNHTVTSTDTTSTWTRIFGSLVHTGAAGKNAISELELWEWA